MFKSCRFQFFRCSKKVSNYSDLFSEDLEARVFYHLIRAEHSEVVSCLKVNPELLYVKRNILDIGGNVLTEMTIAKYAIWSLDWEMYSQIIDEFPSYATHLAAEYSEICDSQFDLCPFISAVADLKFSLKHNGEHYQESLGRYLDEKRKLPAAILQSYFYADSCNFSDIFCTVRGESVERLPVLIGFQNDFLLEKYNNIQDLKYSSPTDDFHNNIAKQYGLLICLDKSIPRLELEWLEKYVDNRSYLFSSIKPINNDKQVSTRNVSLTYT